MATSVQSRLAVRLATLVLWTLGAASCVYWGLRIAPRAPAAVVAAPTRAPVPADPAAIARLLGASPVSAAPEAAPMASLASRFNLLGVVAKPSRSGAALIAVDGGLVLQSVQGRRAVLAASAGGPAVLTLELPPVKR